MYSCWYDKVQRQSSIRSISIQNDERAYCVTYGVRGQAIVQARCFLKSIGWQRGNGYHVEAHWTEEYARLEFNAPEWGNHNEQKVVTLDPKRQKVG